MVELILRLSSKGKTYENSIETQEMPASTPLCDLWKAGTL